MSVDILKCDNVNLFCLGTMMAHRSVVKYMNSAIKKSGVTINQIYLLFIIDRLRGDNLSCMAKKGVMDRTTLIRGIQNLRGYVSLHKNIDVDQRFLYPALTKKGADLLEQWMPKVLDLEKGFQILAGDGDAFIRFVEFFSSEMTTLKKDIDSNQE